jgi:hypothetical protein
MPTSAAPRLASGQPLAVADEHTQAWGRWQLARSQLLGIWRPVDGAGWSSRPAGRTAAGATTRGTRPGHRPVLAAVQRETLPVTRRAAGRFEAALAAGNLGMCWSTPAGMDQRASATNCGACSIDGTEHGDSVARACPSTCRRCGRWASCRTSGAVSPRLSAACWAVRSEVLRCRARADVVLQATQLLSPTPVAQWPLGAGRPRPRPAARPWSRSQPRARRRPAAAALQPERNGYDRFTETNTPDRRRQRRQPGAAARSGCGRCRTAVERTLAGGGVLSRPGCSHRAGARLIRRRIALETVAEASVPRWVSRPVNLSPARSSGLELEAQGQRADQLAARAVASQAPARCTGPARVAGSARSVEQIDDPDARLEGQPPWQTTLGLDRLAGARCPASAPAPPGPYTPGFRTRQTDLQRVRRSARSGWMSTCSGASTASCSLRLAVQQALPPDSLTTQSMSGERRQLGPRSTAWRAAVQRQRAVAATRCGASDHVAPPRAGGARRPACPGLAA